MKRIRFVVLALACICLLCACGKDGQVNGRVTAYDNGILSVQTEKGKTVDLIVDSQKTGIFDLMGTGRENLLESEEELHVQVNYTKKQGNCFAEFIWVDGMLYKNAMQLSDGTPIDLWEHGSWREYCLEDGTVLLMEDNFGGPENHSYWNELLYSEEFSEEAQQGILNYYSEMGLRYDVPTLLEDAMLVLAFSEEFNTQYVSQHTGLTAWNEYIICCQMNLTIPQERTNGYADSFCEGAVFDRETGEHISNFDLFTLTPEELECYLLDQLDVDGTLDRENILLNLKPEQIVMNRNGSMEFYLTDRREGNYTGMLQIGLTPEQAREILHPWAVIDMENNS